MNGIFLLLYLAISFLAFVFFSKKKLFLIEHQRLPKLLECLHYRPNEYLFLIRFLLVAAIVLFLFSTYLTYLVIKNGESSAHTSGWARPFISLGIIVVIYFFSQKWQKKVNPEKQLSESEMESASREKILTFKEGIIYISILILVVLVSAYKF